MRRLLIGTIAALALLASCVTPVIPLPPPDPSLMSISQVDPDKGQVVLSGASSDAHGDALIHVFPVSSELGYIFRARPDGSFTSPPITAADGEQLEIWASRYVAESEPSSVICVVVKYAKGAVEECNP